MSSFTKEEGIIVLDKIIEVIRENKQYLSDIDGEIGDGDHGVNMNKGFTMCREELDKNPGDLAHGLNLLSRVLMMKIGGAMGPLVHCLIEEKNLNKKQQKQLLDLLHEEMHEGKQS